jgi:hypothetical protein
VSNQVQKMIADVSFPKSGDFFAVAFIDREIEDFDFMSGAVVKRKITDRSYRTEIFQCLNSDATRVIGRVVHGMDFSGQPKIFHRAEWRMDDVKHLLPSLGFAVRETEITE